MTPRAMGKGIVLQERDYSLLADLFDSRLMTLRHAAALHFEGRTEAAKKRIQRLKAAGMVTERPRRPNDPSVHHLGRTGYLALKSTGRIDPAHDPGWAKLYKRQRTSDLMLRHELAVMDVKVALANAIRNDPTLELIELSTNPDRHKFRVVEAVPARGGGVRFRSLYIKPDGLLRYREHRPDADIIHRALYIEVDRGTEALGRIEGKIRHYRQLFRKRRKVSEGNRESRMTDPNSGFSSLRVLIVFDRPARRDNIHSRMDSVGGASAFITTAILAHLVRDPNPAIRNALVRPQSRREFRSRLPTTNCE